MQTVPASQKLSANKKLGQLLVETGRITGEQLIRAIQSQRVVGGRLGTCLLEMDVLSEDELLDVLSNQLHVPPIRIEQLRGIEDETLELIPPRVATRCRAVPFASERHEIRVATLDVHNLALLDEIQFCAARRVVPFIANEARVFEALEKYYGYEIPRRYGHLLDRLNRSRYLWDESAKVLLESNEDSDSVSWTLPEDELEIPGLMRPAAAHSHRGPARAVAPARPVREAPVQPTRGLYAPDVPSRPAASPATAPSTVPAAKTTSESGRSALANMPLGTLEEVDEALSSARDLDDLSTVVLGFAAPRVHRCALFQVRQDEIHGWRLRSKATDESGGSGESASGTERFAQLRIRSDEASAFLPLLGGAAFHRGPLAALPAHLRMINAWGGERPADSLLVPIIVRDRVVLVLYADSGPDGLAIDLDTFVRLAHKASMALELFILRRKIRSA